MNNSESFNSRHKFQNGHNPPAVNHGRYGEHHVSYGWRSDNNYNNQSGKNDRCRNDGRRRSRLKSNYRCGGRGKNRQRGLNIKCLVQSNFSEGCPVDPTTVSSEQLAEDQSFSKFRDSKRQLKESLNNRTLNAIAERRNNSRIAGFSDNGSANSSWFDEEKTRRQQQNYTNIFPDDNDLDKVGMNLSLPKESEKEKSLPFVIENIKKEPSKIENRDVNFKTTITSKSCNRSSSNDSSSSTGSDDNLKNKTRKVELIDVKRNCRKKAKNVNKPTSEDEVVCVGKLKRKYTIPDESGEDSQEAIKNRTMCCSKLETLKINNSKSVHHCLICDKKDHTSFHCQMICKNCSAPYHNLKTCPESANANVVLQSFMEFCMYQLNSFNPELRFSLPVNVFAKESTNACKTMPEVSATGASNKQKIPHNTNKKSNKKRTKVDLSDSEDNAVNSEEDTMTQSSDLSHNLNNGSSVRKTKKKRLKIENSFLKQQQSAFPFQMQPHINSFVSGNPHFNPILYNQILSGAFPSRLNFN